MSRYNLVIFMIFALFIFVSSFASELASNATNLDRSDINYAQLINFLNFTRVNEDFNALQKFVGTTTGYPGLERLKLFLTDKLINISQSVLIHQFTVVSPIDRGSEIIVVNNSINKLESIPAYAMWPNYIQTSKTSKEGVTGPLVYVGKGNLEDFVGKHIEGSIVLMDLDSKNNWLYAAMFGAKGVIYLPTSVNTFQVNEMISRVPIHFPRLFVSSKYAELLKNLAEKNKQVILHANMSYETVRSWNMIAKFDGTSLKDEIIVICTHVDSWSIVPSRSSSVNEALGIATLLEIARFLKLHPPARTVWLVFYSGYWQALAGQREFLEDIIFGNQTDNKRIVAMIGVDLYPNSEKLSVLYAGSMYGYAGVGIVDKFQRLVEPLIFDKYLPRLQENLNEDLTGFVDDGLKPEGWWDSQLTPFMLDTEPFAMARGLGFTLRSGATYRLMLGVPSDVMRPVELDPAITRLQVVTVIGISLSFASDPEFKAPESLTSLSRIYFTPTERAGVITLKGSVVTFEESIGWYRPVANALVVVTRDPHSPFPFSDILTYADENGTFVVHGIGMGLAVGGLQYVPGSGTLGGGATPAGVGYYVEAFVIDKNNGLITYAPDFGQYGLRVRSFWMSCDSHPYEGTTVVFRSATVVIFNIIDIYNMVDITILDPRFSNRAWRQSLINFLLYDFDTLSEFTHFSIVQSPKDRATIVFVPPNSRFALVVRSGPNREVAGILTNASVDNPEGVGYFVNKDKELKLYFTPLLIARDLFISAKSRYSLLRMYGIRNYALEEALNFSEELLNESNARARNKSFSTAYDNTIRAWAWSNRAYIETMNLIQDSIVSSIAFFILLLPFSFLFESLVFGSQGRKKIVSIATIAASGFCIFYIINPSVKLATNILIGYLGLMLLALLLLTFIFVFGQSVELAKTFRKKVIGLHFAEVDRLSSFLLSFSLGIGNMRKRKMRTLLVGLTVAVVSFSLVALTSTQLIPSVYFTNTSYISPYNGFFIRNGLMRPSEFLSQSTVNYIRSLVPEGSTFCPRVWYYPQSIDGRVVQAIISTENKSVYVSAIIGLSYREVELTSGFNYSLIEGNWFKKEDYYNVIIPHEVAKALGAKVGERIYLDGIPLVVSGIINESVLTQSLLEITQSIDKRTITPLDPNLMTSTLVSESALGVEELFVPLPWQSVVIVPYDLAIDMGGSVVSISVKVTDPESIVKISSEIVRTTGLSVVIGINEKVSYISLLTSANFLGMQFLIFPVLIAGGTILSSLLGAIKERENEIKILSSIGLSPLGVGALFLAEVSTYAVIGSLLGYIGGMIANITLVSSGLMPREFTLNYSSISVVLSLFIAIALTFLSAIYPVVKTSKLVTPSLERKWSIPTKPVGDLWTIPVPFRSPSMQEAVGVLRYLHEYLSAYENIILGSFIIRSSKLDLSELKVKTIVALLPIEANVLQDVEIRVRKIENLYNFEIFIHRLSGEKRVWITSNYAFVDSIRRQLLLWRSLNAHSKERYLYSTDT
jgi:hypothetical protein